MNKLKGKCKSCFGCNKLEEFGFKGRKKCKNYIKADNSWFEVIIVGTLFVLLGLILAYGLYRFSILCGG